MQAIVLREFGGPDVLRYEEAPPPTFGPGEVLVQVHAVSVNRTLDLKVRQDGGGYGVVLPHRPDHAVARGSGCPPARRGDAIVW